uniref:Malectin-like domain-containing protein n=1 Tax=Populus alba TaxID=43335 RepID=A0A4U5QMY9_POPAL|nr:hypothetical protein D5086_0000081170 [Populus alba]
MKTECPNGNSWLAPVMFLPFFFIACCTVPSSADKPSYYIPPDRIAMDCSPSVSPHDAGFPYDQKYEIDFSSVSRVYAVDPTSSEKPRISACIFRKQVTLPFIVSDGPNFIRLYFKLVTYSGYGEGIEYLTVAIGSNNGSYAEYGGPILNGLEIFKLSDISNNLAGIHPFGLIVTPHPNFSGGNDAVIIYRQEAGSVRKEVNRRKNDDLSIMIDGQRCSGFDISDPTPGVEFSEIKAPTGR